MAATTTHPCSPEEAREFYRLFHSAGTVAFRALRNLSNLGHDLSITETRILLYLEHHTTHPFYLTQLARALHVSLGWVSRAVSVLVKEGLIESLRDQHDRRLVHLKRTDKGTEIARLLGATLEASLGEIPPHQRKTIAQFLQSVAGKLNDKALVVRKLRALKPE